MNDFFALEYLVNPSKRLFWIYLLSSIFLAIVYFYVTKKNSRLITSSKLWLHPSAKLDYYYFFLSYFINILLLVPFIVSAKTVALFVNKELYFYFDYYDNSFFSYKQIVLMYTISIFVVSDFTRYWLHRFLHTIPFLWEFHKIHHSAKVLTPITFYRVHPVENFLFGLRYSLSVGFVTGVFIYFFGAKVDIYMVFGVNIILFVFSLFGSNLRHSHIPFSYGEFIEKWLLSPKQHQIHHDKKHFNKNFGGYIAIWDRLFGSLTLSKDVKVLKFGLRREQMKDYLSLKYLIIRPFINLLKRRGI
ncbi:sterol desaturase family protein [Aliarcobacter butzleri]|jgi:sterol desaturase/sphingolipid hydroxylase (fatty acid hydroxylase superfamily)|uniref:Sterol desaturase-related protein n=5 Tax=Aliarcobacter butzleri TaxID=28197 RepID=A8EVL7_ALIB4|nr:sterol desaturase family protein [Aliarcobacter butzleri]ABV67990.1 sterol desaturase-related protein [Aliarcobacter butzleri RM4018]MCG3657158.1 sterol desaturase family protein [Aliarcobacter butzleri]MCG3663868.1 sterol desaturase family protein [Aliarcobacter butzleri]MCG3678953.1 sterol desaturase family protein [Aliarcobacter butzleri]MCG3706449.1 sterol desaturase family protein [Aliarcobacter butzleri]